MWILIVASLLLPSLSVSAHIDELEVTSPVRVLEPNRGDVSSSRELMGWFTPSETTFLPGENLWEYTRRRGHMSVKEPTQTNRIAICTSMRGENSTDIREWVTYYRWLGVDHIFLTENRESPSKTLLPQLKDFIDSGFLTHIVEPMRKAQMKSFYDCAKANSEDYDWLAFFDVDEFLLLRRDEALKDVLNDYKQYAGLSVHWVLVGSSGMGTRPPEGGVLRHYGMCAGKGRHLVKTIANTQFLENISTHPHNFQFRDGMASVDEQGEPIPFGREIVCTYTGPPDGPNRYNPPHGMNHTDPDWTDCRHEAAVAASRAPAHKSTVHEVFDTPSNDAGFMKHSSRIWRLALMHYTVKSRQDFEVKVKRGSANAAKGKDWSFFQAMNQLATETDGVCTEPAEKAKLCCPPEQFVLS